MSRPLILLLAFLVSGSVAYGATTGTSKSRPPRRFLKLKLFPTAEPSSPPKPMLEPTPAPKPTPKPTVPPAPPEDLRKAAETERERQEREAQRLFDLARGCIKRDRRGQAKTYLRRLARDYPKSDLAPHALVQIAEIEDDLAEADNILTRVIHDYPNTEWAEVAWYKRGEVNMLLWDYATALEMFGQYLKRNPRSNRAGAIRLQTAICQLKLGQAEKALAELEQLSRDLPAVAHQPETLETLAECHVELGRCDHALGPLETLITKHPTYANFSRAFLLYALCLEDRNRFDEAIDTYGQLVQQFPRSPEANLAKLRLADLRRPLTLQAGDDRSTSTSGEAVRPTTPTRAVLPLPAGPGVTPSP